MTPQWRATFVRRWHTNCHLSHTNDPVGYHSGRMSVLALSLWPDCSRELLAACITHDLGEVASGDIPCGAWNKAIAEAVAMEWEAKNGLMHHWSIDEDDRDRLKFLDRLDAYYWALHHAPEHVRTDGAWIAQRGQLLIDAAKMGVTINV